MPKLVIENGPDRGRSYIVQQDGSFFAGRDSAAQVPIPDEMASRRHFQIEVKGGTYRLRDLDSSNGTLLNGKRLKGVQDLVPQDRIQVGATLITFLDDKPHPLIGKEIAGYRILDRVGRGGMGTVYRALQTSLDRIVALKILAPHLVKNTNFVNLFIREARAAGALSHPNIVQVYDVGVEGETYFFSMEYIPDGSVEDILNRDGTIPLPRALQIVRDAALGLEYAEQKGVIHRDIKPGNLMVGSSGIIKIGDLGIARSTDGEELVSQKDGVSGSPHFIAPEQARGLDIDHRVDLYSLGVSFYQILCGKTPFTGTTPREVILKHLKEEPVPLRERVEGLPEAVDQLVRSMMAKDRDQRIPSARALIEAIDPLLRDHSTEGDGGASIGHPRRVLVGICVVVALAGLGAGIPLAKRWNDRRIQARQDRRVEVERRLVSLEEAIVAERVDAAETLIVELEWLELPEDLARKRQQLVAAHRELRARLAEEERIRVATAAFAELQQEIGDAPTPEGVSRLEEFARQHPDTERASQAAARAREWRELLARRARLEREAAAALERHFAVYQGYMENKQYAKALQELDRFEERYRQTPAGQEWQSYRDQLRQRAETEWENVQLLTAEELKRENFDLARRLLTRFADQVGFEEIRRKISAELIRVSEFEELSRERARPAPGQDAELLAAALPAVWQLWSSTLETRSALQKLEEPTLRFGLSPVGRKSLDDHRRFLEGWEPLLEDLVEREPPVRRLTIRRQDGDPETVEVLGLDDERGLIFRRDSVDQYYKWPELSDATRVDLLERWSRTPREKIYVGFIARTLGLKEPGQRAWDSATGEDPSLAPLREQLEELLALAGA